MSGFFQRGDTYYAAGQGASIAGERRSSGCGHARRSQYPGLRPGFVGGQLDIVH